jgi:hypothetical protein
LRRPAASGMSPHSTRAAAQVVRRALHAGKHQMLAAFVAELPAWIAYKLFDTVFALLVLCVLRRFRWTNWLCDFFNWETPIEHRPRSRS